MQLDAPVIDIAAFEKETRSLGKRWRPRLGAPSTMSAFRHRRSWRDPDAGAGSPACFEARHSFPICRRSGKIREVLRPAQDVTRGFSPYGANVGAVVDRQAIWMMPDPRLRSLSPRRSAGRIKVSRSLSRSASGAACVASYLGENRGKLMGMFAHALDLSKSFFQIGDRQYQSRLRMLGTSARMTPPNPPYAAIALRRGSPTILRARISRVV